MKDAIVDRVIVMRAANAGLVIIRERTLSGKFLPGSSPGADQYSTKPFARPLAGLSKAHTKALMSDQSIVFTKDGEAKQIWILVKGGYKQFRSLAGKNTDHVTLTWSGRMMRNLGILNAGNNEATLGMKSDDTKQLALYHNSMGAGKSRRKHVFMGFTDAEKQRLTNIVGDEVMKRLRLST
ncbi:MAG: hypothetical protein AB1728_13325 [Bacteroidota bacterium]